MKLAFIRRIKVFLLLGILGSPLPLSGLEKPPLDLSPEDRALLEKGELVFKIEEFRDEHGDVNHRLRTFRLINAPPDQVWAVLAHPEKDFEWIPGVELSEVLSRNNNYINIRYQVVVLFMTFQFHIHRVFYQDLMFIKNDLIDGMENDLKVSDSYYALYPADNGHQTLMNYSLLLVVNQNIPKAVEDWFAKQSCKGWMENLKKRAESRGTWKK